MFMCSHIPPQDEYAVSHGLINWAMCSIKNTCIIGSATSGKH